MGRDRFDHKVDLTVDHKSDALRRVEVITGVGRRRNWPDDFKAMVVAESLEPGVVISQVARRHGLTPQQLFGWRNQTDRPVPSIAALASWTFPPTTAGRESRFATEGNGLADLQENYRAGVENLQQPPSKSASLINDINGLPVLHG